MQLLCIVIIVLVIITAVPPPLLFLCFSSMCLETHLLPSTIVGLQNQNCFCNPSVLCVHLLYM